jgi:hypothetical protein
MCSSNHMASDTPTTPHVCPSAVVLAALLSVSVVGCDGALRIDGVVLTAPGLEESRIYIDQDPPRVQGARYIAGAVVTVTEDTSRHDDLWKQTDTTPTSGAFRYYSTTCPCEFTPQISVSHPAYGPVTASFLHHPGTDHRITVLLAPAR